MLQIDGQDLSTPLDLDTVKKDQFRGIVIFDRWQLNPIMNPVINSGPQMGLPKFYQIVNDPRAYDPNAPAPDGAPIASGGVNVHYSRIIRFTGIDLPFFQAITEQMWGESILERLWDRLISFDNVTMSAASLVDRASLRTVNINGFREVVAAGGEAQAGLMAQFEMMRLMQVNEGLTLLDKEDEFKSTAYSFAGLADMVLQFAQQLSGASGIPLMRLFGQPPAGLGATGDADIRMYYDNIKAQQESKLSEGWTKLLAVMWRSTYGVAAPEDLDFTFTPLWQMSQTDKANVAKTTTESALSAFEAGITTQKTTLQELREQSSVTGIFTNITDEDINAADDEPPVPGEMEDGEEAPMPDKDGEGEGGPVKSLDGMTRIKKWLLRK